jgi:tetratricopeptide (TPR) repeat protein
MHYQTLAKALSLALALITAAASLHERTPGMASAHAQDANATSEADITYFYRNPSVERVARIVSYLNTSALLDKPSAEPATIGFLAAAFDRYPKNIDAMIPQGLSARTQGVIALSLRLAGQETRAKAVAERLRASGAAVPDPARVPASFDSLTATGPNEFDMLWGASFATGDPRYASRILARFAAIANVDGNAEDMLTIARSFGAGADLHWVTDKHGADQARELIIGSSALWALQSNAEQHDFVRALVNDYIRAHPAEPAAKALLTLGREYGHYDIKQVISVAPGASGKPSVTVNIIYLSRIVDDLGRHAAVYPPHFESAEDRQRAERDVVAISALLDPISDKFSHNPVLLMRLALLHAFGHNLDVPGSAPKAVAAFTSLLNLAPDDPQANYRYGVFLASSTKSGEAIPLLEKAKSLGVSDTDYWLGWSYAVAGNKAKAVENLESYTKRMPGDQNAAAILDAVRNDKFNIKPMNTPP